MKKLSVLLSAMLISGSISAQKFMTREGYIKFFGSTPMENIEAVSSQASSVIDASNNAVVFQVLLNSFTFEKALMQEHFNENYVESEKYPKAVFKGNIVDKVEYSKPGTYKITLKGTMSLHGVDKAVTTPATLIVEKGTIKLAAEFQMIPEDYNIAIPGAVREKIAKQMDVTVKCSYQEVK